MNQKSTVHEKITVDRHLISRILGSFSKTLRIILSRYALSCMFSASFFLNVSTTSSLVADNISLAREFSSEEPINARASVIFRASCTFRSSFAHFSLSFSISRFESLADKKAVLDGGESSFMKPSSQDFSEVTSCRLSKITHKLIDIFIRSYDNHRVDYNS